MSTVVPDPTATDSSRSGPEFVDDPRGGFVLALVVLLLFGIGVAGAAGYQVVLRMVSR